MIKKSFTFENFYVGEENKIAYLAAQRIIEMPGIIFNPLYIYAGVGLGKSHLLWAIYSAINTKLKTKIISGLEFIEELKKASAPDFKVEVYSAECFILDDFHLLGNDPAAVTEILHILEKFLIENRQIVVSANVPPSELKGFDLNVISRLEGGLVCEIGSIKEVSRVNILKKKAAERGLILPDEIALEISQVVTGSVRELEGALNRLIAYSTVAQFPLDLNTTRLALRDYYRTKTSEAVIPSILEELKSDAYQAISIAEGEAMAREEFKEKIYVWEMKGFDVSRLKALLNEDIEKLKEAYDIFMDKIKRLIDLQKEYGQIDARQFPDEAMAIEPLLFNPERVDEVEKLMITLRGKLSKPKFEKTFDDYIIGECNEVAYNLAMDMIKNLGKKFNPFVIVGGRGCGKTHLALALADKINRDNPNLTVKFYDLRDSFPQEPADVLILDNLDLLPKDRYSELGSLLNQYVREDRQMIMTSAVPSLTIPWSDEIKYLFEFGIDAPLTAPDPKTIGEYLQRKGQEPLGELPVINSFYDLERLIAGKYEEEIVPLGFEGEKVAIEPVPEPTEKVEEPKFEWVSIPSIWSEETWEEY